MRKTLFIVLLLLLLPLLLGCGEVQSLNIPEELAGKELRFELRGCDYKLPTCPPNAIDKNGSKIGVLRVQFLNDNIRFTTDSAIDKDIYFGELFKNLRDVNAALNKENGVGIWTESGMAMDDYEETMFTGVYILLFKLHYFKSGVRMYQNIRLIFNYNADATLNRLEVETGLDISNLKAVKLIYNSKDYPRSDLNSFKFLGRILVGI